MAKKTIKSNQLLSLKLKHYSALAASVVALDATSQVVYTDIRDTTLVNDGDYFDIDLNNDGIREGRIEFIDFSSSIATYGFSASAKIAEVDSLVNASINVTNSVLSSTTSTSSTYVAAALNLNASINNNLNSWSTGSSSTTSTTTYAPVTLDGVLLGGDLNVNFPSYSSSIDVGKFPGAGDKFLGVKFTIGTSTHYGWLRLDMSIDSDSVTIKDFAYESLANTTILAGDTGGTVGLSQNKLKNKIDYYSSTGKININSELTSNSILSIYDLSGKLVQSEVIGLQKEVSVQGDLEGIYIVEIRGSKGVTRKKLWLESN